MLSCSEPNMWSSLLLCCLIIILLCIHHDFDGVVFVGRYTLYFSDYSYVNWSQPEVVVFRKHIQVSCLWKIFGFSCKCIFVIMQKWFTWIPDRELCLILIFPKKMFVLLQEIKLAVLCLHDRRPVSWKVKVAWVSHQWQRKVWMCSIMRRMEKIISYMQIVKLKNPYHEQERFLGLSTWNVMLKDVNYYNNVSNFTESLLGRNNVPISLMQNSIKSIGWKKTQQFQ